MVCLGGGGSLPLVLFKLRNKRRFIISTKQAQYIKYSEKKGEKKKTNNQTCADVVLPKGEKGWMGEEVSRVNNTFGGVDVVVPSLVLIMLAGTDPDERSVPPLLITSCRQLMTRPPGRQKVTYIQSANDFEKTSDYLMLRPLDKPGVFPKSDANSQHSRSGLTFCFLRNMFPNLIHALIVVGRKSGLCRNYLGQAKC